MTDLVKRCVTCPEIGVVEPLEVLSFCDMPSSVLVTREVAEGLAEMMNANCAPDAGVLICWYPNGNLVWVADGEAAGPLDNGLFNMSSDNFVLWS